jgi:hypothetical protein
LSATTPRGNILGTFLDPPSSRELAYNMNNGTVSGSLPVTFWIDPRLRQFSLGRYGSTHIIAKVLPPNFKAPMRCFGCCEKWVIGIRLFTRQKEIGEYNVPTILTCFELAEKKNLIDLCIPVTNSILATLEVPENTEICVEMTCPNTTTVISYKRLRILQRRLMVFLTDLVDNDPNPHIIPCPEIWMDGHCKIVEAEFERRNNVNDFVRNKKYGQSFDELEDEEEACVSQLIYSTGPVSYGMDDSSLRGRALKLARFLDTQAV